MLVRPHDAAQSVAQGQRSAAGKALGLHTMHAVRPPNLALFCDLYEFTMAEAYLAHGMDQEATFSLFVRKLPKTRNFLLACGVSETLALVAGLRFGDEDLAYLRSLAIFSESFLDWVTRYRFTGTIHAVREGTPLFANEPILEVSAPIAEAQILETLLINQVHLQTVLASKGARVVAAARGRRVVDFGSRRAQGAEAALAGARAFHIAGVDATSNVLAGARYGIPVAGTMAHSFVEACGSEREAFRRFAEIFPETTLLVDTYDTLEGVRRVVALARELGPAFRVKGVRLDSGDLASLAGGARAILDEAGLRQVQIFASGGLDETKVAALIDGGAPIDAFGVGTDMSVSADAPSLDIAYKLTAYAGEGRLKLSAGKRTLPGRKQVFRGPQGDVIGRAEEDLPGEPLLQPVMKGGRLLDAPRPLAAIRSAAAAQMARLDPSLRGLAPAAAPYPVSISPALAAHEQDVVHAIMSQA
jgi:nicotinate phosphoribosyltransferase